MAAAISGEMLGFRLQKPLVLLLFSGLMVALAFGQFGLFDQLVPLLQGNVSRKGQATAYVCERRVCRFPTTDPEVFVQQLRKAEPLTAAGAGGPS